MHPLQLYFAATALFITVVGIWHHRRERFDGEAALFALLLFSASSAFFELFRAKTDGAGVLAGHCRSLHGSHW